MNTLHFKALARSGLAVVLLAILLAPASAARELDPIPSETRLLIDQASRALTECTVAAARRQQAILTPESLDRAVISQCVEQHGELVELSWTLSTPDASRVLLKATVEALEAARRAVTN